jgi:single-stranded-DNA-specific exonuclease
MAKITDDKVIVVAGESWNEGVVGIVASRLVNHFQKPAIVLSIHNGIAKGSGRSIGNVDLYALIKSQEHLLAKFGGHKMAAGLSMNFENVPHFRALINDAAQKLHSDDFIPQSDILGELDCESITFELLELLQQFELFREEILSEVLSRDAHVVQIKLLATINRIAV